ncbi:hypothetical protein OEZ85_004009 [Tetradesmus obliquus]|uniref:BZIP domain-containing protein n=1 Tax=Tetradesmus obliquus TaxID=3088 RepID=A0ABY8UG26_TETOB|nr:hypothetical protein OEZ85_004009 [Tetradesmus obliquus]
MGRNVPVSKPGRKKKLYQDLDNATNSLLDVQRQVTALQRQQSRLAIKHDFLVALCVTMEHLPTSWFGSDCAAAD